MLKIAIGQSYVNNVDIYFKLNTGENIYLNVIMK